MLVIDEEQVQYIVNSIAYLEEAEANLSTFLKKLEGELPRRINKEDCIEVFTKFGLFRSYTLREQIAGKRLAPKKAPAQKEMVKSMPTPSPPKRGANLNASSGKQGAGPNVQTVNHDEIEFSVDDSQTDENPFSPASPQTTSPAHPATKPKKKKKKQLIQPFPTNVWSKFYKRVDKPPNWDFFY